MITMKNVVSTYFILQQLENPDVKPVGGVGHYKEPVQW